MKTQIIRGSEPEFHPVPLTFHSQLVASAVEMPVKTPAHPVGFQQLQDFRTFVALISGRVMEEYQFRPVPCRLQ